MRLRQRARTTATPAQVWEVLGDPARWPEFELFLRRVRGAHGRVGAGHTLVGVGHVASLGIPIDVVEAVPPSRLVLRVHVAPGVVETVTFDVVALVQGGSELRVTVVVEGLFARAAVAPLWLASGLTVRLLAARAERIARAARRAA